MAEPKEKSLAELQKLKLQSEIDKNDAERREAEKRTAEIEKRLNRKWYVSDTGVRILGGLVAIALIVAWAASVLLLLIQTTEKPGRAKLELAKFEKATADSLPNEANAKTIQLENQVQLITARLDSTTQRDQEKLASLNIALKKEETKSQRDQKKIDELAWQKLALQEEIQSTKQEKAQIKKIAESLKLVGFGEKSIKSISNTQKWQKRAFEELIFLDTLALKNPSPYLEINDVERMLIENNFFDSSWNSNGTGVKNQYEPQTINGDKIIVDRATNLTWQQSGSPRLMKFDKATSYIKKLNDEKFAGFHGWRLPTLEEAMSLTEPVQNEGGLFVDPVFDKKQAYIWTADKQSASRAWGVYFGYGSCGYVGIDGGRYCVRAVR